MEKTVCSSYSASELRAIIRYERERRQKAEALVEKLKRVLKEKTQYTPDRPPLVLGTRRW